MRHLLVFKTPLIPDFRNSQALLQSVVKNKTMKPHKSQLVTCQTSRNLGDEIPIIFKWTLGMTITSLH